MSALIDDPGPCDTVSAVLGVALALAASAVVPAASPAAPRVLVLDLQRGNGVNADETKTVGELVIAAVSSRASLTVISHDDIRQLAALAADKVETGCDDNACLSELAGALAADYVVSGRISRLGDIVVMQLSLFDGNKNAAAGRATRKVGSVGALADEVDPAVDGLLRAAGLADDSPPAHRERAATSSGPRPMALAGDVVLGVAGLGALTAVGAGVVGELSLGQPATLTSAQYKGRQGLALAVMGVAAAVAVAGGVGGGALVLAGGGE